MNFRHFFSFLLALMAFSGLLSAGNWPQFRGPTAQGRATDENPPLKWSATENIEWKTELPGEAWSSPIVWLDRVFVTTATDSGESCHLLSLDRKTGKILWDKEVFKQRQRRKQARNTFATPTPATDGERVYAVFNDGGFVALNLDGSPAWVNRDFMFYGEHGLASSPILRDGMLIMARDGSNEGEDKKLGWQQPWDQARVIALDAKTGRERWQGRRGLSRISHGSPCIWENNGRAEVVTEAGDVVQGFDLATGERIWSSQVIGEGKVPSAVLGDGLVFTAGGWGGKETIKAFKLGGHGDLKETNLVWEQKKGMPKVPSMIYLKPYLFAITDGGVATCMKANTGEIVWQERVGGNFAASPVEADGRLYFVGEDGVTTVIAAGPEFRLLAKNPLGEKVQASPAISQNRIFIRTEKNLFCVGAGSAFPSTPAPVAHWKFDELSGEAVVDSSGGLHHGKLLGASRVAGKYGGAIECGQDALVEVPHTATLDHFMNGFTVSAWVRRDADATWNMIISREVKNGPSEYFGLAVVRNRALFSVDPDGAHYQNIQGDEDLPVGEWIHLTGTYDNALFRLYVNGTLVKSASCMTPFTFADENPVVIGGNTNSQGRKWVDCFHGRIDEVRLYDRALTADAVQALAKTGPTGAVPQ